MSNDWFRFRQFLIRQEQSAMKVGTDGVLLGAWAETTNPQHILDIGTGTGLIALMMAQRYVQASIDAIEIDPDSAREAAENVSASPWSNRIKIIQADFLLWESTGTYDLILCNPPYFKNSLLPPRDKRSAARHEHSLPLTDLVSRSSQLLTAEGSLAIVIPAGRLSEVEQTAGPAGLYLNKILQIRGTNKAPVKRVLIRLDKNPLPAEIKELVIEPEQRGVFSEDYRKFVEGFYL
ncbi:MAG: methyltransferase [Bacteroidota bacterium]